MKKPVAFDLDDLIVHTAQPCLDYYQEAYGVHIPLDRYYDGDVEKWGAGDIHEASRRLNKFIGTDEYFAIEPAVGAKQAIEEIAEDRPLYVVTGRPYFVEKQTKTWVDLHLPGLFRGIFHTSHYLEGHSKQKTKVGVCRDLGVTALVDDLPTHLALLRGTNIQGVLHGTNSWSEQHGLGDEVVRTREFQEVVNFFSERE